jgi:hypothetical protein
VTFHTTGLRPIKGVQSKTLREFETALRRIRASPYEQTDRYNPQGGRELALLRLTAFWSADRVHTRLADAPDGRPVEVRPSFSAKLAGLQRVGGLHHRYAWQEAA